MAGIFVSYRRNDAAGFAGRLAEALEREFGAAAVFRDQDDIRGGDDFVAALDAALNEFSVMLVVIGPGWVEAKQNGRRRLDDEADFVRIEVRRGLESGKAVLPVLVAGAAMPAERDLPPALAGLARRQAIVIAEADWQAGLARLIATIRPLLGVRPRRRRLLALGALVTTLAGAAVGVRFFNPGLRARSSPAIGGRWQARVVYDWGDAHDELFDLKVEDGELRGSASYLRLARPIRNGKVDGERIGFSTESREMLAGAERELRHDYRGRLVGDTLELTLETSGGSSPHAPVDFLARRLP